MTCNLNINNKTFVRTLDYWLLTLIVPTGSSPLSSGIGRPLDHLTPKYNNSKLILIKLLSYLTKLVGECGLCIDYWKTNPKHKNIKVENKVKVLVGN